MSRRLSPEEKLTSANRKRRLAAKWRREHPELAKRWAQQNREKTRAYTKAWAARNPDKVKAKTKRRWQDEASREKQRKHNSEWHRKNRASVSERNRRDYHTNYDKERNQKLRTKFGITLADYQRMFDEQAGACAICKRAEPKAKTMLSVDHDHATGAIRGLLCSRCNPALGLFRDDVALLLAAAKYLERK